MELQTLDYETAVKYARQCNIVEFLHKVGNPCSINIPTTNNDNPPIVITTLLHGNEASGVKAMYELLRRAFEPSHPVTFIIASISAALTEPVFTHRMLPGQQDLNRCFSSSETNPQCALACAIKNAIIALQPRCVIDIHNTSGSGPAFSVATKLDDEIARLSALFCERLIVTDIRLGALMEVDFNCPVLTVEAGGAYDSTADIVAREGIINIANRIEQSVVQTPLDLLLHPRRALIEENSTLIYANSPTEGVDLCLRADIEKFNFGLTPAHTALGISRYNDVDKILATDLADKKASDYFYIDDDVLKNKTALRLFMVTTRADIAKSDCLFYFVPDTKSPAMQGLE